MSAHSFAPHPLAGRRIPLAEIDAAVVARLGATRGLGNSQPACFNRQVAMYLAKHMGKWSTKTIGRYYGGRDHSTVCYGIQRIQSLRESNPDLDTIISELCWHLRREPARPEEENLDNVDIPVCLREQEILRLAELVADKVCAYLEHRFLWEAKVP